MRNKVRRVGTFMFVSGRVTFVIVWAFRVTTYIIIRDIVINSVVDMANIIIIGTYGFM